MKVKFVPQNVEFEISPGQSVLHVAQDHGVYIKSVCKGVPSCAECRVRVVDGDYNALPPGGEELALIGTGHFIDRRRLSCQLKCFGDITVDMTEQIAKEQGLVLGQKKRKMAAKDDRIEDAHAIRQSDGIGASEVPLSLADDQPVEQKPAAPVKRSAFPVPVRPPLMTRPAADARSAEESRSSTPEETQGEPGGAENAGGAASGRRRRRRGGRGRNGGGSGGPSSPK